MSQDAQNTGEVAPPLLPRAGSLAVQRALDILFSASALVALAPLLLPVMLLLRLTGEGEVFFRQKRVGLGGRDFDILKFATMLKNSPNIGAGLVTVRGDPRILPVGNFLRKTKINELPQLWNVLRGDMSVVGPRPLVRRSYEAYDVATREALGRLRPGISGLGSLVFRDEEAILHQKMEPLDFYYNVIGPYKGQLEMWYYEHASVWLYLKVIAMTLILVAFPDPGRVYRSFPGLPRPPAALEDALLGPRS